MKRSLPIILFLLCVAAFFAGIEDLLKRRFDVGDVYPAGSTLRSDPLGASAFYESLGQIDGITVSRDYRITDKLPEERGLAYLQLSGSRFEWEEIPEEVFKSIDSFVKSGGRLVVALRPEPTSYWAQFHKPDEETAKDKKKSDDKLDEKPVEKTKPAKSSKKFTKRTGEETQVHLTSLRERWGIDFGIKDLDLATSYNDTYAPATVENHTELNLPDSLDWHSGVVMTNLDKAWKIIYARGEDAVVAERKMGSGTVVFATDTYFLSNEALAKERHADLLAWVAGPCRKVIFDEAHFGIVNDPGIASLMRKYRLHAAVVALLALAGLFIWQSACGFGPVRKEEEAETSVAGKDSASGFVNLLRHHIPPQGVLQTCVEEWKKSLPKGGFSNLRLTRVETYLREQEASGKSRREPVAAYQEICRILDKGRPRGGK